VDDIRVVDDDMQAKGRQFKSTPVTITEPTNPLVGSPRGYLWGLEGMRLELLPMAKEGKSGALRSLGNVSRQSPTPPGGSCYDTGTRGVESGGTHHGTGMRADLSPRRECRLRGPGGIITQGHRAVSYLRFSFRDIATPSRGNNRS